MLIKKAEDSMRKLSMNFVWFGTNSDNIRTRKLYGRSNYEIIGKLENFKKRKTGEWVDQYIYGKKL